jgi:uncharacterized membrane protein YozB (DUF420 family)
VFRQAVDSSPAELALNGVEAILSVLALVFVVVGCVSLYRNPTVAGARPILSAVGGALVGLLAYIACLLLIGDESTPVIDACFGVYFSLCAAIGGYGFLRLCRSLK